MKNNIVSYARALGLKSLGFNEETQAFYEESGKLHDEAGSSSYWNDKGALFISAPTVAQANEWERTHGDVSYGIESPEAENECDWIIQNYTDATVVLRDGVRLCIITDKSAIAEVLVGIIPEDDYRAVVDIDDTYFKVVLKETGKRFPRGWDKQRVKSVVSNFCQIAGEVKVKIDEHDSLNQASRCISDINSLLKDFADEKND